MYLLNKYSFTSIDQVYGSKLKTAMTGSGGLPMQQKVRSVTS